MRRFHVHVAVNDISKSTAFYTKLFGQPSRVKADYVKWMLEDPRLNFADFKPWAKTWRQPPRSTDGFGRGVAATKGSA